MQNSNSKNIQTSTFHLFLGVNDLFTKIVRNVSKEIFVEFGSKYVIGEYFVPHFTLYLFAAPFKNTEKIIKEVEALSNKINAQSLTAGSLFLSYDGWLMIEMNEDKKLFELHKASLKQLNFLREGELREKYRNTSEFENLPDLERGNLLKYGDRHAITNFHPHVSIAEFDNMIAAKNALEKYKNVFKGQKVNIKSFELVRETTTDTNQGGEILYKKDL